MDLENDRRPYDLVPDGDHQSEAPVEPTGWTSPMGWGVPARVEPEAAAGPTPEPAAPEEPPAASGRNTPVPWPTPAEPEAPVVSEPEVLPEAEAKPEGKGLRKEIRLFGKSKPKAVEPEVTEPVAAAEQEAKPAGKGLRKEIHLFGKPKPKAEKPKEPKEPKAKKVKEPKAKKVKEPKAKTEATGLRKEIHLFGKRKPKAATPEKPAKATKETKPKKIKNAPAKRRGSGGNEIVGLKIGATGISAAQVVNNGTKEVLRVARGSLPRGVVDGGEVRDPVALGKALSEFFAEHSLPRRGVRLGIANSRIGVRVIEVAGIDDETQLANAIGFRAHEMLSVPVEESVLDYHVLSVDTDETGQTMRKILLVVAYRESVDRYLEATDAAKLSISGIDLEAFALLRNVQAPDAGPSDGVEAAVVAANIGHERTTLAIADHGICSFARVLEWGGANIGAAIGRALKLTPSEAEEHKHNLSLEAGREGVSRLSPEASREAVEAARYELQNLVRELLSSLRFHQGQQGSLPLARILITGGTSNIPGLAAELERELGIPVATVDPLARFDVADGVEFPDHPGAFAVALGLGIED